MAKKRSKPKADSPAHTDLESPSQPKPQAISPAPIPAATSASDAPTEDTPASHVPSTQDAPTIVTYASAAQQPESEDTSAWSSIPLVAVTVSVDYHGELMIALPRLIEVCDHVVLITDPRDELTVEIAQAYGCELLLSRNFRRNGAKFNKAEAVHIGQKQAHRMNSDAWYLVVDSDIVIPSDLQKTIYEECVDPKALYGMSRLDYDTPEQYASHTPIGEYKHKSAGYFQLYNRTDILYPPWSESAAKCDISFARRFSKHVLLSGYCHHLGVKHVNWEGRTAPPWLATQEAIDGE